MIAITVVQTAILLILSILVAGLLRAYAAVLQRLHQIDGGQTAAAPPFRTAAGVVSPARPGSAGTTGRSEWGPAQDISGTGLTGEIISIRTVGTELDTLLVFLSSGCVGCAGFWDDFRNGRERTLLPRGRVLVVTKDPVSESTALLREMCPAGVDLVMSTRAWEDYGVPGSPYVVVVDGPSGRVKGEGSGTSLTQVSGLVHQAFDDLGTPGLERQRSKPRADAHREVDADRVLLAAGIHPGHPSLYPTDRPNPAERAPGVSRPEHIGFPGIRSEHSP